MIDVTRKMTVLYAWLVAMMRLHFKIVAAPKGIWMHCVASGCVSVKIWVYIDQCPVSSTRSSKKSCALSITQFQADKNCNGTAYYRTICVDSGNYDHCLCVLSIW